MNFGLWKKLGALFKPVIGLAPLANSAGTRNGSAIDRSPAGGVNYAGCTLAVQVGTPTGSPTSFTVDVKLQDSADGSTGWADYKPDGSTTAAITQATAAGLAEIDVDLSGAKRYIRVVEVVAFVGGSSPAVPVADAVILVGADRTPV